MVHSYIAAQAAISAHLYDNNVHPYWPDGYTTPNILGYYTTGKAPSLPYLVENKTRVRTGSLFNYFNKNDFALGVWKTNNRLKPDEFHFGYSYHDEDKDPDTYAPLLGDFFIQQFNGQTRYLDIYSDRLEIFARCAQSRSQTLGSETSAVDGFSPLDLEASFGYGDKHYYHSMEFRSNIINQRPFWSRVGKDFLLEGFNDLH